MSRKTLTLRPAPARFPKPQAPTPPDPHKIALSLALGLRYVCREGRYTQQVYIPMTVGANERTWVDIPLVPEVYG